MKEFVNEINILSQINHKDVVELLGCCFEDGTDVPSIVYEYVPNGTLYDHLHDKQKACLLTWNHRLRIATQVAQVLAYLHNTIRVSIIHRDIKSKNILLDNDYNAKVSDFGASRLITSNQVEFDKVVEDGWESDGIDTNVLGTFGYLDPEYAQSGRLTKKTDVFGFGIVLAELLTRQEPYCAKIEGDERYLAFRFCNKVEDKTLVDILDAELVNENSMPQLQKVAHLAAWCLKFKAEDRPSIRQAVRVLEDISGF